MDGSTSGIMVVVVALFYFIPTLVAFGRGVRNAGSVLVINLFLGWTLVGWVVALAMAARSNDGVPRG
ncbi:superinfection immunity protein [Streptomyces sp. NPDC050145]|uniref:superinfection immunity protein n=1 Tax=Streptomyces sp. NPDC050145 TaxID=3365602 RepID=UPI0037B63554